MTRKRFKKLLMGMGCERDRADQIVFLGHFLFGNYEQAWKAFLSAHPECKPPVMPLPEKEAPVCE